MRTKGLKQAPRLRRTVEAVVVGAGPAGLSAAAMLRRAGVGVVVLERTDRLAAPWHTHYDNLRLQSPAFMSYLPGLRFARGDGRWVTKDSFLEYLGRYVEHHELDVRFGVEVGRIDRFAGGWRVATSGGEWTVPTVVVATGYNRHPRTPGWPGADTYQGPMIHSSEFRNAEAYRDRDVLVVGTGNSGSEIAYKLTAGGAGRVRIAVRTPPNVVPRTAWGFPTLLAAAACESLPPRVADVILGVLNVPFIHGLHKHGLPKSGRGIYSQYVQTDVTPIIDTGFVGALKKGRIEPVAKVTAMEGREVVLADGTRLTPDAVIACTGYRCGLEPLVGHLGVLTEEGKPAYDGPGAGTATPGLFFIGYTHPFSGNLRRLRFDAPALARTVRGHLDGELPRATRMVARTHEPSELEPAGADASQNAGTRSERAAGGPAEAQPAGAGASQSPAAAETASPAQRGAARDRAKSAARKAAQQEAGRAN